MTRVPVFIDALVNTRTYLSQWALQPKLLFIQLLIFRIYLVHFYIVSGTSPAGNDAVLPMPLLSFILGLLVVAITTHVVRGENIF